MDKAVLRNFAIESRKDLMEKIDRKIKLFYVDEEFKKDNRGDVIVLSNDKHTLTLTKEEDINRDKLLRRIIELGYEQVVEEAAYTWFNRIIAIRYMEINDFLPLSRDNQSLGIRVLSSSENMPNPEILKFTNLSNKELDLNISMEKLGNLTKEDEKFKYVLLLICNKIGSVIPQVFDGVTDYIDILIPDNMLSDNGFIYRLIKEIPETSFSKVEIIGWLYQYYNQTEHDRVINARKAKNKNEIAYATQIFTPDWIVKYMVENSLGKLWVENSDDDNTSNKWEYFIKDNLSKKQSNINPESIKFIDPCCGSGHILVYAFEVFIDIYLSAGYIKKNIPSLILQNNIYGLDVDDRAGQLSILSLLLKAREYDNSIFRNTDLINNIMVQSIQETASIEKSNFELLESKLNKEDYEVLTQIYELHKNAKDIGSLLIVPKYDYDRLIEEILSIGKSQLNIFELIQFNNLRDYFIPVLKQAKIMSEKYDVIVTNPPYLNNSAMPQTIKDYLLKNFKDEKWDLFSAFIRRNLYFSKENSYLGFMTPNVWMFISSYEKLRESIIENNTIDSLIQLAKGAFFSEATVDICTFIINSNNRKTGSYFRLEDFKGGMDVQDLKFKEAILSDNCNYKYIINQDIFKNLPGYQFGYWLSNNMLNVFKNGEPLSKTAYPRQGMATTNNNLFLRQWFEVDYNKIGFNLTDESQTMNSYKWFPYNKGGEFRKWYGNNDYVVNFENMGKEICDYIDKNSSVNHTGRVINRDKFFKKSVTWSKISSGNIAFRFKENGFIFDVAGTSIFGDDEILYNLIGFLNSKVTLDILSILSPTLNYEVGHICSIPLVDFKERKNVTDIVKENIKISKEDWDSFETSWNFTCHPLINSNNTQNNNSKIEDAFKNWSIKCNERFNIMKKNEEELNSIFIKIYGLENELNSSTNDKDITIRKADQDREIKSLISYAVGCMFGRYSLDKEGLIFAGGKYEKDKYNSYMPDNDNIIPISDDGNVYYNDDIVGKFKEFIKSAFGEKYLNDNLNYIAETLGKKGTESSEDTIRRYFVNDFYNDHIKLYQKRPIYWLFDSGKKNGFKCLIYSHRYDEQIVSKIRTKYLHNTIAIYERSLSDVDYKLNNEDLTVTDKRDLQNRKLELSGKINECNEYEELVGNVANKMIKLDLDDGVTINYEKFVGDNGKSILGKIK